MGECRSFVVADIPGIIEGAHEGRGLGLRFLRHIERTRSLAFLIPVDAQDLQLEYDQLRQEVERYSNELAATPHCVVVTKTDLLPPEEATPEIDAPLAWGVFHVSAVARRGLDSLLEGLYERTRKAGDEGVDIDGEDEWWVPR